MRLFELKSDFKFESLICNTILNIWKENFVTYNYPTQLEEKDFLLKKLIKKTYKLEIGEMQLITKHFNFIEKLINKVV